VELKQSHLILQSIQTRKTHIISTQDKFDKLLASPSDADR